MCHGFLKINYAMTILLSFDEINQDSQEVVVFKLERKQHSGEIIYHKKSELPVFAVAVRAWILSLHGNIETIKMKASQIKYILIQAIFFH